MQFKLNDIVEAKKKKKSTTVLEDATEIPIPVTHDFDFLKEQETYTPVSLQFWVYA